MTGNAHATILWSGRFVLFLFLTRRVRLRRGAPAGPSRSQTYERAIPDAASPPLPDRCQLLAQPFTSGRDGRVSHPGRDDRDERLALFLVIRSTLPRRVRPYWSSSRSSWARRHPEPSRLKSHPTAAAIQSRRGTQREERPLSLAMNSSIPQRVRSSVHRDRGRSFCASPPRRWGRASFVPRRLHPTPVHHSRPPTIPLSSSRPSRARRHLEPSRLKPHERHHAPSALVIRSRGTGDELSTYRSAPPRRQRNTSSLPRRERTKERGKEPALSVRAWPGHSLPRRHHPKTMTRVDLPPSSYPSPTGGEGIFAQAVVTNGSARSSRPHPLPCHIGCTTNRHRLNEAPVVQPRPDVKAERLLSPGGREPKRGGSNQRQATESGQIPTFRRSATRRQRPANSSAYTKYPSSRYFFSLLRMVRAQMPSCSAACFWLLSVCSSACKMACRSISSSVIAPSPVDAV